MVQAEEGEPFVLHPGEFVLGSTLSSAPCPTTWPGRLEGKSSLGRLGLLTHSTAGFIDQVSPATSRWALNVANLPITLWPGMKIGQLCLLRLTSPAEHPYGSSAVGSKYQGQRGPTPSRSYLNFVKSDILENAHSWQLAVLAHVTENYLRVELRGNCGSCAKVSPCRGHLYGWHSSTSPTRTAE